MSKLRVCSECPETFVSIHGTKTCSEACRVKRYERMQAAFLKRRADAAVGGPANRKCNMCGKPYIRGKTGCKPGEKGGTKYGSKECQTKGKLLALQKLSDRRKRDRAEEKSNMENSSANMA